MLSITDSHVHFWDPNHLHYAWLSNLPTLNRPFLPDHVPPRGDGWNVEGIVFAQADCAAEQGLAEVDWVTSLAANDARVRGIVAFASLERGEGVLPVVDALAKNSLVKGIRRLIQDESPGFAIQPDFVAGVQLLAEYGLSFDICVRHHQLGDVIQLVRRCPQVNFVLDHAGKPDIKRKMLEPWRTQLKELATLPNVSCKLSGMITEADWQKWHPGDLRPYIQHALDVFGVDRVMFGSDAPVLYLASSYARWVSTLQDATTELAEAEKQNLWHDNAAAFYRL